MEAVNGAIAAVAALASVVLIAAIVREALGGSSDFQIRHRPRGRTTVRGQVSSGKIGGIAAFFDRDLAPSGPVTVRGTWGPGRTLRLKVDGRLSAAERQRVRNFLMQHLR